MFRNQRIYIFAYYFITVNVFLITLTYLLVNSKVENFFVLTLVFSCFIILCAVFISKLSVDPLEEYVSNLQNLSKETLHELNLPISTIKTNLQILEKKSQDSKDKKRLNRIKNASEMLQQRYNELDYMIKTQTQIRIEESFNLDALIKQRVDFLQSVYPHISFKLVLETTEILNDKIGLGKVIDNIIDNGVKYSPNKNNIDITLQNNTLDIKDYGKGMDEVELVHIFDNYYQSNNSMKGFGIGLGMVKRFCDANDIVLNISSKPNAGTTITLNFKRND